MNKATPSTVEPTLQYVDCVSGRSQEKVQRHKMAYWQWLRGTQNKNALNSASNNDFDKKTASILPKEPYSTIKVKHLIICVHGLTRQGRDFDALARFILVHTNDDVAIVCPDVAGRGQSDWLQEPTLYQVPIYTQHMLALLAQLRTQFEWESLDWVGTSMGGLIGMAMASGAVASTLGNNAINRLVLNDVGPQLALEALSRIGSYVGQNMVFPSFEAALQALHSISTGFGVHTQKEWATLNEAMVKPVKDAQGNTSWVLHYDPAIAKAFTQLDETQYAQMQQLLWNLYDSIACKTLVLRGAQSDLLSEACLHEMMRRGPKAQAVTFENVGHAPTLVSQSQQKVVFEFLFG